MGSGDTCARSLSPEPPYLGKKDIPPISGIGYHLQLPKHPLFRAFLGNRPETTPQNTPFSEKMGRRMQPPDAFGGWVGGEIETASSYITTS